MDKLSKRKLAYKSRGSPLAWKDQYRKNCFERLRTRRANLIEQYRFATESKDTLNDSLSPIKLVNDVMETEWNALHQNRNFPSLSFKTCIVSDDDSDDELMREILAEIQRDLQNEDEMLLNEVLQFDSGDLNSRVQMLESEEVICPICQVNRLEMKNVLVNSFDSFKTPPPKSFSNFVPTLTCRCGLSLSRSNLTTDTVRSSLHSTISDHEKACTSALIFSVTDDIAGRNVLITCSFCDWMTFLL